tara:strand:- start:2170 stop:4632 length:2463 start_codon:yes stop_codon:yes gene_type:complete
MIRKITTIISGIILLLSLYNCGGGTAGDGDQNVVRTIFAVGDVFETVEDGGPLEGDVSSNDIGENLTFALSVNASMSNGELNFNSDGTFVYTPDPDFFGSDSVTYDVTDSVSGESDSASLTINVENDFEFVEEYGWELVWSDEFNGDSLDNLQWTSQNASVSSGNLYVGSDSESEGRVESTEIFTLGRFEIKLKSSHALDFLSSVKLVPHSDIYDGVNQLQAYGSRSTSLMAGAEYGFGLFNAVIMNDEVTETISEEFHTFAIEWGINEIRWYIDGSHVHTLNTLHTWAYTSNGDGLLIDNDGPFNQSMKIVFETSNDSLDPTKNLVVDYVRVWSCNSSVEESVEECASAEKTKVSKLASDRIETVGPIETRAYSGGYYDQVTGAKISDLNPLSWHYTDELRELNLNIIGSLSVDVTNIGETEIHNVLEVTSGSGTTGLSIDLNPSEIIGQHPTLNFDLYLVSKKSSANSLTVSMMSENTGAGYMEFNFADINVGEWVTFSMPMHEFLDNSSTESGTGNQIDMRRVTSLMHLLIEGEANFYLDNINISCINSESCIQGPFALQSAANPKADPIRYEAEDYISASGTGLEDTLDEGGGQNVAFVNAGDYLVYTISAPGIGPYSIDYRVASLGGSQGFEVSIDGEVVDNQTIPDTGDWQNWTTITSSTFDLVVGLYTLRIDFIDSGVNLNWFELQPPITEIFVEAEDYDDESGISLEDTTDDGGGQNIGYIDEGDWVEYTINIPSDGTYLIEYRLASAVDSFGFTNTIGGVVVDTQTLLSTGDWQSWITQSAEVDLLAGEQLMRLDFLGGAININWIKLTRR